MSDRCNKTRKLSAKKAKHRRCYFKMNKTNGGGSAGAGGGGGGSVIGGSSECAVATKNQRPSSVQQFCIDSNIMVNSARKCSFSGKKKRKQKKKSKTKWQIFDAWEWMCARIYYAHPKMLQINQHNNERQIRLSRNCWKSIAALCGWYCVGDANWAQINVSRSIMESQCVKRMSQIKSFILNADIFQWSTRTPTETNSQQVCMCVRLCLFTHVIRLSIVVMRLPRHKEKKMNAWRF